MNPINSTSETFKNILYAFACLSFCTVIGGAVYEHLCVVPRWSAAPPHSLAMFQGDYGLNAVAFWKPIHPVTILLITAALVVFRKSARRKNLLLVLGGYVVVLAITFSFFVPELVAITSAPYSESVDANLTQRANVWETLSLLRLGFLVVLSVVLLLGLTKSGQSAESEI